MNEQSILKSLLQNLPQIGTVEWLGLRPARRAPMRIVAEMSVDPDQGIIGDHYTGGGARRRQITLIQAEHVAVVQSCLARTELEPSLLRRNIVVRGINLLALKQRRFYIGEVVLETTGTCEPYSLMETVLGTGGYNAMRGHGGITARIIHGGLIRVGDRVGVVVEPVSS